MTPPSSLTPRAGRQTRGGGRCGNVSQRRSSRPCLHALATSAGPPSPLTTIHNTSSVAAHPSPHITNTPHRRPHPSASQHRAPPHHRRTITLHLCCSIRATLVTPHHQQTPPRQPLTPALHTTISPHHHYLITIGNTTTWTTST